MASDLELTLEYLAHQWLPIEVREAYQRLLRVQLPKALN